MGDNILAIKLVNFDARMKIVIVIDKYIYMEASRIFIISTWRKFIKWPVQSNQTHKRNPRVLIYKYPHREKKISPNQGCVKLNDLNYFFVILHLIIYIKHTRSINSIQLNSIQINSIQIKSIQFNSIQFRSFNSIQIP